MSVLSMLVPQQCRYVWEKRFDEPCNLNGGDKGNASGIVGTGGQRHMSKWQ
jgi:hypothetical protein